MPDKIVQDRAQPSQITEEEQVEEEEEEEEVGCMGTSGNRECQLASKSILKGFTDNALFI